MTRFPHRILMSTDAVGGVWSYSLELARGLAEVGVEVVLATMGPRPTREQRDEVAAVDGLAMVESDLRLEWMQEPWDDVDRAGRWLLELEEITGAEIVHLGGYAHGQLPFRSPTVVVGHSCVASWWRAVKREDPPREWDRYRREVAAGLTNADAVVAPTRWMLEQLRAIYDVSFSARVIANARHPHGFRPATKQPIVLSAGRMWDEAKNLAVLERAAPRCPWPIYVAGDVGSGEARVTRALGQLSSHELSEWLGRAAIYVLPARYEPFGLSALEAALAGCVLVLGDLASLREVWGDAAIFVDPDDPGAIATTVEDLAASPGRRLELSRRARQRALVFAPHRQRHAYLDLYSELLGPRQELSPCVS